MNYIIKGHDYLNEIQTMTQVFYPNEKFTRTDAIAEAGITAVSVLTDAGCESYIYRDGILAASYSLPLEISPGYCVKKSMFLCLRQADGYLPDWGMLTGIRPSKLVHGLWAQAYTNSEIIKYLADIFFVSKTKAELCIQVAEAERNILSKAGGYSLYIGIPFCPSRCLYCSFTAYPIAAYGGRVDDYLDALDKELSMLAGQPPDTVYIGGGTPAALDASRLERMLKAVARVCARPREYTVEAGRPDAVDREKLRILKAYGVTRITLNTQTMHDRTLLTIGREHTAEQFLTAFGEARGEGHDNINVDLILGLPGENAADIYESLQQVLALHPENITVHTLAVKRASRLKTEAFPFTGTPPAEMRAMLKTAEAAVRGAGFLPYYMYRQKNMSGNFENLGYAVPGRECVYNVHIMAETQTILAFGAGAVTKTVDPVTGRIDRIFNVKNVDEYIKRIDEMIERKRGIL